jgi:hypothetical protein
VDKLNTSLDDQQISHPDQKKKKSTKKSQKLSNTVDQIDLAEFRVFNLAAAHILLSNP